MASQTITVNNCLLPTYNGDGCPKNFLRDFAIKSEFQPNKTNKLSLLKQCLTGKAWDLFVHFL